MHAIQSGAAKAVGSSLSELVLAHEHNLWHSFLDLRVVADCHNMCNGCSMGSKGSVAPNGDAGTQQAVGSVA